MGTPLHRNSLSVSASLANGLTADQDLALRHLEELAAEGSAVELLSVSAPTALGSVSVEISISCAGILMRPEGIRIRQRERFTVRLDRDFPFSPGTVTVAHSRWAGAPHVQWGRLLCLYAAPSVEWVPADGVRGLIGRLTEWLDRAAKGELDPLGEPLHPPVAYSAAGAGVIIVRPDIGALAPAPNVPVRSGGAPVPVIHDHRFLVALCEHRSDGRTDLVAWITPDEWLDKFVRGELGSGRGMIGALAILTDSEMSFEYPDAVRDLLAGLEGVGVARGLLLSRLAEVAAVNNLAAGGEELGEGAAVPLRVLIGTPSRRGNDGQYHQHLVCWQVDDLGREIVRGIVGKESVVEWRASFARRMEDIAEKWLGFSQATWVQVLEARPEITQRRDHGTPAQWLRDKSILLLGAGALGGPIAEFCIRAGCKTLTIVDKGQVSPGILVRQPYGDDDIGRHKAEALADRLNGIRLDEPCLGLHGSAESVLGNPLSAAREADLIIDATADAAVASYLERCRWLSRAIWPLSISMVVGHDARRGLVTVSPIGAAGSGRDIMRRLTLAARGASASRLGDVNDDFFPLEGRHPLFQPEPGCSSPTFVGSAPELAALAGHLFDEALSYIQSLAARGSSEMAAGVVRLGGSGLPTAARGTDSLTWRDDHLVPLDAGYEVRISRPALRQMLAECRRGERLRGRSVETGGTLFGEIDDACRVIWVDDATGPPPDSSLSPLHFEHGVQGLSAVIDYHRNRSGRVSSYLGMWHCHPDGQAAPSPTDQASTHVLVSAQAGGRPRALMLILGAAPTRWSEWLAGDAMPDMYADLISRTSLTAGVLPIAPPSGHKKAAWPGGWAGRRARRPAPRRRGWLSRLAPGRRR